jgi:DNA-binding transcriptional ArsR family regulator
VWDENNGPKTPIPPLPPKYVEAVVENVIAPGERTFHVQPGRTFEVGSRNNALYHLAMRLAVGRMPDDEIMEYCQWAGKQAGMAESEIKATTVSAIGRGKRQERNLTKDVRELVAATTGDFIVTDIYRELEVINREDKNTIRVALARLKKDGIIEKSGRKDGGYRRVSTELVPIEWKTAPTEEAGIILPLGLNRLVNIYPKNIMVASGLQNAGKTAFCMETARLNMGHHKVVYFSSEMGASELSLRLSKRQDIKTDDWNVEFYERSSQFVDVIRPDWVNIVDYLEVNDEFWRVGQILTEIHDRLTSGVALVSIQKNEKTDYGRGGTFSAEKPRLYIAINPGEVKIVKAKNWKGTENPNGKVKKFTIQGGWKFVETSDWYYPEQEERTGGRR